MSTYLPITKIYDELQDVSNTLYFIKDKLLPAVRDVFISGFLLISAVSAIYTEVNSLIESFIN